MIAPATKIDSSLRIVFLGDIVGKPGMKIVCEHAAKLRQHLGADLLIVNAENAADGAGLTSAQYHKLVESGIDAITLGDHIYKKKEIASVLKSESNIVKPANFPTSAPGNEFCIVTAKSGQRVAVISLLGRVFMRPVDCPFLAIDRVLSALPPDCVVRVVDIHAEATSDKQVLGRYLDGRVSAVLGTHTHVATADEQILPGGTAFQCDVGMTGPYESILGREIEPVINTTLSFDPNSFHVATEDVRMSGACIDIDPATGRALQIHRLQLKLDELIAWGE
jgi:2',3'-cyclic-nucleotide 2'-phosphodiesterase